MSLTRIPRSEHPISRQHLSSYATKVLYRLHHNGYDAFLVGGGVRDVLLGKSPKDFDITTNATPEQVHALFKNSRLIGRRFRIVHIMFGREIIEVATFRGHHDAEPTEKTLKKAISAASQSGMLLRDNVYGTIEEDSERRDFTVNALYYNIADFSIHDYVDGVKDLNDRVIRMIGDPEERYHEDPVRMIRAIRFAVKLDMTIEAKTAAPIRPLAHLLSNIPAARLFEESLKLLQSGQGMATYRALREYHLFDKLFPRVSDYFTTTQDSATEQMIEIVLTNTDARIKQDKRINPAFMFAAFLWYPLQDKIQSLMALKKMSYFDASVRATNEILSDQVSSIALPKRHTATIREIWQLQMRLTRRFGKRAFQMVELSKFRAGFDMLEMRGKIEQGETQALAHWWQEFQDAPTPHKKKMVQTLSAQSSSTQRNSSSSSTKRAKK